jgi:hypothetical protein
VCPGDLHNGADRYPGCAGQVGQDQVASLHMPVITEGDALVGAERVHGIRALQLTLLLEELFAPEWR